MHNLNARVCAALLGAVLALGVMSAARATTIFTYTAICTTDCAEIGLADGAAVSATFGFADASVTPNALLGNGDVVSFSATMGNLSFGLDDLGVFFAQLDAAADRALELLAIGIPGPQGTFLIGFDASVNFFIASVLDGGDATGDRGELVRVARVPEPAPLLLLFAGVAMIELSRRRRLRRG